MSSEQRGAIPRLASDGQVLVLSNADMAGLVTMPECVEAVEQAYRELGQGRAQIIPRSRLYLPLDGDERFYWFNNISGALPSANIMAVRLDSAFVRINRAYDNPRMEFPGDFAGLVLLFAIDSREPVAILHDHAISVLRQGAVSAVGARYLAPPQARTLGIFGAGQQARQQVAGVLAVRPIQKIKIFSPSAARHRLARDLTETTGVESEAVDDPEHVVPGCDVVITATNASRPLFRGEDLEPGCHVIAMVGTDGMIKRREIDLATVRRSEVIVLNDKRQVTGEEQPELFEPLEAGVIRWEQLLDLAEVVADPSLVPRHRQGISLHDNNVGMGIQFAAVGALMVAAARRAGLGTRLPADLFMTRREGVYAP